MHSVMNMVTKHKQELILQQKKTNIYKNLNNIYKNMIIVNQFNLKKMQNKIFKNNLKPKQKRKQQKRIFNNKIIYNKTMNYNIKKL